MAYLALRNSLFVFEAQKWAGTGSAVTPRQGRLASLAVGAQQPQEEDKGPGSGDLRFAASGGAYSGYCTFEAAKEASQECRGLDGIALEACWAEAGCDVVSITDHYSKVANFNLERGETYDGAQDFAETANAWLSDPVNGDA